MGRRAAHVAKILRQKNLNVGRKMASMRIFTSVWGWKDVWQKLCKKMYLDLKRK
jgi:hypothetical protein